MGKDWAAAPLGDGDAAGVGAAPDVAGEVAAPTAEPPSRAQQLLAPAASAAAEGVEQRCSRDEL